MGSWKRKMAVEWCEACGANLALVGRSHNFRPRPKAEPVGTKPGGTKLARRVWCHTSRRVANRLRTIWTTRLSAGACPSEGVGGPNGSMDEFWLHDPSALARRKFRFSSGATQGPLFKKFSRQVSGHGPEEVTDGLPALLASKFVKAHHRAAATSTTRVKSEVLHSRASRVERPNTVRGAAYCDENSRREGTQWEQDAQHE
jgi:hypothetical protein